MYVQLNQIYLENQFPNLYIWRLMFKIMQRISFGFISVFIFMFLMGNTSYALKMKGIVYERDTKKPLENVYIFNTYTEKYFITDSTGKFSIDVERGQLIEFQKISYKLERVRISSNELPYYSIAMVIGPRELEDVRIVGKSYKMDSIIDRETYKWAIDHYTLDGLEMLQHPFDAMSKSNRQIWAFQKHFDYFEKEKYIDYVFNTHLIQKITPIDSSDILEFKMRYRPRYGQIKAWNTYEYYDYIKKAGADFLRRKRNE